MTEIQEFFDAAYRSSERYWWRQAHRYSTDPDDHPASLMTQSILRWARQRPPGRALDIGSGEGTDAIRLALLGWQVEAVELSGVGATKVRRFMREAEVEVTVHHADIRDFTPAQPFDLIVCNGVLHYIEDKSAVCKQMQEMTTSGGMNAVSLWSTFSPVPPPHQVVPTFPDDEGGAVVDAYGPWRKVLLYLERNKQEAGHHDMDDHAHSFIKLIAEKPFKTNGSG
ncbi:class I SAM-dependent methyltransferase [Streptomyces sp. NBC_01239]|uniref:class I SAM-dependent methyltransferase n=1 Tax=Streptomyces sp. NBC_01239 TaxID=2903792 RepID=UPI00225560C1|nr:class I SAM-dependent methyltransferase [Streptomyces sp. NBC_01239]MCX4810588.1 class I SAM-dependent methyltransferase [Streptomyces sp. NBC_01239]